MPTCDNCQHPFSWSTICKANLFYRPVYCGNCGTEHHITLLSRFIVATLTVIPLLVFGYFLSPYQNIFMTMLAGLGIAAVGFLLTPYAVHYRESET